MWVCQGKAESWGGRKRCLESTCGARQQWRRRRERAGKCKSGAERKKSQGFPLPPTESPHRAGRETPCWRCVLCFPSGTGQAGTGQAFVQSPAGPKASRAVMGASGGALSCLLCRSARHYSTGPIHHLTCVQTSQYPASQSGLIQPRSNSSKRNGCSMLPEWR